MDTYFHSSQSGQANPRMFSTILTQQENIENQTETLKINTIPSCIQKERVFSQCSPKQGSNNIHIEETITSTYITLSQ